MRDADIRVALRARLDGEHVHELNDTLFVEELGLCGQVRVDLAVVNGSLSGYELKSARDTLRRLPMQVDYYSQVFDFATLVVAACHSGHAIAELPNWWGCIEASMNDGRVVLTEIRPASGNPAINAYALAQLLWRDEALEELDIRGMALGVRSKPRVEIWARLAERVPLAELRLAVRTRLKGRQGWRPVP